MPPDGNADLARRLAARDWKGLLVVGENGRDPDLCRWTRGRHLGLNLVWVGADGGACLVYFADMEREEAAATGIECLGPGELGLAELRRETGSTGELIARTAMRLWRESNTSPGQFGLGGRLATGDTTDLVRTLLAREWQPVSGRNLLRSWRRRKLAFEIEDVRRAAGVTVDAFLRIAERLRRADREPVSVGDLRRIAAVHFARHELEQPQGNIVASGRASAVPHSAGEDGDPVAPGQTLVVDLYPRSLLYADCTRTFCLPPIPRAVAGAHATVREALERGRQAAVAGTAVARVVGESLGVIEDAGYPTLRMDSSTQRGMVHSLGHGLGYELHELPNLRPRTSGSLDDRDLITIEPGIYDPQAEWGVRLEDVLLLEGAGNEQLTPLPYDLDPRAWPEG